MTGVIKAIHERGFGFITVDGTATDFFFHQTGTTGWDDLREGDRVTFEPGVSAKGPRANNVQLIPDPDPA